VLAVIRACSLEGEVLHLLLPGVAAFVGIGSRFVLHTLLHPLLKEGKSNYLIPLPGFTGRRLTGCFAATARFILPATRLKRVYGTGAL
jgi:hypothetical protein